MRPAICSTVYSCIRPEPQWNRLPELACQAHNGLWGSSKVNVFCKTWLWILDRISGWGNCKAKVSCWFGSDPIFSNLHEGKLMSASAKLYFSPFRCFSFYGYGHSDILCLKIMDLSHFFQWGNHWWMIDNGDDCPSKIIQYVSLLTWIELFMDKNRKWMNPCSSVSVWPQPNWILTRIAGGKWHMVSVP